MLGLNKKISSLAELWQADIGDHVQALAWSPDNALLAAAAISGPITVFKAATAEIIHTLPGHGFGTTALSWSSTGQLASAGQDGKVRLWDSAAGTEIAVLDGGAAWVERVAWNGSGSTLASAGGKKLRFWNPAGQLVREFADHRSTIADIGWKPGALELACIAYGQLTLYHPEKETPGRRFDWKGSMLVLAWSPDGKYIATGDQDSTVHFWIMKSGGELQMAGYALKVRELAWDSSSRFLATGGGTAITVWDCSGKGPEGSTPLQFDDHADNISVLAFQRLGPILASGGADGLVCLYQPGKFKNLLAKKDLGSGVSQLLWSGDDRLLAAGTEGGQVALLAPK